MIRRPPRSTLFSLHDALPIYRDVRKTPMRLPHAYGVPAQTRDNSCLTSCLATVFRSEEHTSELQSPCNLVCRLLLEKKKKRTRSIGELCTPSQLREISCRRHP